MADKMLTPDELEKVWKYFDPDDAYGNDLKQHIRALEQKLAEAEEAVDWAQAQLGITIGAMNSDAALVKLIASEAEVTRKDEALKQIERKAENALLFPMEALDQIHSIAENALKSSEVQG